MSDFTIELKKMAASVHETAKQKGWWEKPKSPLECQMLMISEISEACEETRKGTPPVYKSADGFKDGNNQTLKPGTLLTPNDVNFSKHASGKLEGELIELADAVIRVMDYCEFRGWDLGVAIEQKAEFNKGRNFRHGGKLY